MHEGCARAGCVRKVRARKVEHVRKSGKVNRREYAYKVREVFPFLPNESA
jgi:hypothetical protein